MINLASVYLSWVFEVKGWLFCWGWSVIHDFMWSIFYSVYSEKRTHAVRLAIFLTPICWLVLFSGSMFLSPVSRIGSGMAAISLYGGLLLFSGFLLYDTQLVVRRAESHPAPNPYEWNDRQLGMAIRPRPFDPINKYVGCNRSIVLLRIGWEVSLAIQKSFFSGSPHMHKLFHTSPLKHRLFSEAHSLSVLFTAGLLRSE